MVDHTHASRDTTHEDKPSSEVADHILAELAMNRKIWESANNYTMAERAYVAFNVDIEDGPLRKRSRWCKLIARDEHLWLEGGGFGCPTTLGMWLRAPHSSGRLAMPSAPPLNRQQPQTGGLVTAPNTVTEPTGIPTDSTSVPAVTSAFAWVFTGSWSETDMPQVGIREYTKPGWDALAKPLTAEPSGPTWTKVDTQSG